MLALREQTRPIPAMDATRVGAPTLRRPRTRADVLDLDGRKGSECISIIDGVRRTFTPTHVRSRHARTARTYEAPHRITAADLPSIHVGSDDTN